jgi:hypothetical protein
MSQSQKIRYFAISGCFFLFALVQWNDPDPVLWSIFYALMAVIYLLFAFQKRLAAYIALLLGFISFVAMGMILPEIFRWFQEGMPSIVQSMKATVPTIEYTREFLGLFLSFLACIWVLYKNKSTIFKN